MLKKTAVICPTYNAGSLWVGWVEAVLKQNVPKENILVLDSGSSDDTVDLAKKAGFRVLEFPNNEFNHGHTRNFGADYFGDGFEFLVYLTQDALLVSENEIESIIKPFENEKVGAVCGRQIPHKDARPIESHARIFNYPERSVMKGKKDIELMGIKTAFMSNSFAAYRYQAFIECGKFPNDTIFAEDMSLAAKMILKEWSIVYSAESRVRHSHSYTLGEEFRRYFDVGVFYNRETWIAEKFGSAGGEGLRFVVSELKYLATEGYYYLIPIALVKTAAKLIAFKLGGFEKKLPVFVKKRISMNKRYWI